MEGSIDGALKYLLARNARVIVVDRHEYLAMRPLTLLLLLKAVAAQIAGNGEACWTVGALQQESSQASGIIQLKCS